MHKIGSVVRLKAGGDPMTVAEIRNGCDGTGNDGLGLRCMWFEDTELKEGWFSESSIELAESEPCPGCGKLVPTLVAGLKRQQCSNCGYREPCC